MVNITVSKVLSIIVVLVGIGVLLWMGWTDSDWAHPIESIAEYQRNVWQGEIDREEYRKLQEARTQADIQEQQEELEHARRLHEAELQRIQAENDVRVGLLKFAGVVAIVVAGLIPLILAVGLSVYIARRSAWTNEEMQADGHKRQIIEAARRREREEREAALYTQLPRMPEIQQPDLAIQDRWREIFSEPIGSNGGVNAAMNLH